MTIWKSPLRYPGGKLKMVKFVKQLLTENKISGTYVEGFAGGAGIAINLLMTNEVERIVLNDLDIAIYSFWKALVYQNEGFLLKFDRVKITIEEWHNQKSIFDLLSQRNGLSKKEELDLGFATYYLNRTNFSGIIRGATPIGGLQQNGKWKMDCQFNKANLRPLLEKIGEKKDYIIVTNYNMITEFEKLIPSNLDMENLLIFIDPPYIQEGRRLYLPIKELNDHKKLSKKIISSNNKWILTYDMHKETLSMYEKVKQKYQYQLRYYVKKNRNEIEFLAVSDKLKFPDNPYLKDCKILA